MKTTLKNSHPWAAAICIMLAGLICLFAGCKSNPVSNSNPQKPEPVAGEIGTLLSPNGGETYRVGDTISIQWDLVKDVSQFEIRFSADEGLSWFNIAAMTPGMPDYDAQQFKWAIPDSIIIFPYAISTVSQKCMIQIAEYTVYDNSDVSDAGFAIQQK
jgi:hypothetical protein